jgi:hypothetical protein
MMQMIPESARYKPFFEFIYNNYYHGRATGLELIRKQNQWDNKSEDLYKLLKVTGAFTPDQLRLLSEEWTLVLEQ